MVRMRAKATEPRIVPAKEIIESSLLVTFHLSFIIFLQIKDSPKMAVKRDITQMHISKARKDKDMTS